MANWSNNAKRLLDKQYLRKNDAGEVCETPDRMLCRVAECASECEEDSHIWYDKFLSIMDSLEFLPNTPTLMNAGTPLGQLSACLTGDTVVRTCGGDFTIEYLAEKYQDKQNERFDVYSVAGFNELAIGKAFAPRKTRTCAKVYKVLFNDGSCVRATNDHLVMMRNGKYKRVEDLCVGESVMPFNHDHNNGYLIVFAGIDRYAIAAHKFVYEKSNRKLETNEVVHHIDYCKGNNDKNNLEAMDKESHYLWHSQHLKDFNPMHKEEARRKVSEYMMGNQHGVGHGRPRTEPREIRVYSCDYCHNMIVREEYSSSAIPNVACCDLDCQWNLALLKAVESNRSRYVPVVGEFCQQGYKHVDKIGEISLVMTKNGWFNVYRNAWCGNEEYICHLSCDDEDSARILFADMCGLPVNHNVVSVTFDGYEDVYDLSVEKYHNFAANNVFVHNCFVLPVEDDLSAIFEAVKQSALIHKSGGGTGFSFSKLRAANSMVRSSGGIASGPVSFIHCFDVVTETVKQGGRRRGANLGCMRDSHPDIFEFVDCKSDGKSLPNFNISVCITDKFMEAVYDDDEHWLRDHSDNGNRRLVDAMELFDDICTNMWSTGEPGVIFIDRINNLNPTPWLGRIEATNPCLVGSTKIETVEGQIPIKDLVGMEVPVFCYDGDRINISWMRNIRKTGVNRKVYRVLLDNGESVISTGDHKFMLRDGTYKMAEDLISGESLMPFYRYKRNSKGYNQISLNKNGHSMGEAQMVAEWVLGRELEAAECVHHVDGNKKNNSPDNLEVMLFNEHSRAGVLGNNNPVVKYPECNHFGKHKFIGEDNHKWRKDISTEEVVLLRNKGLSYQKIADQLGCCKYTARKRYYDHVGSGANHRVVFVEFCGYDDVYDGTVDDCHNFAVAAGVVVHNCGEQPLLPYESCNLGSIDVSKFVGGDGSIGYDRLSSVVGVAVRFLDNIIDVNEFPRAKIRNKTRLTRKIGLGVMGWATALHNVGLRYDSEDAINLAEKVMKFIQSSSYEASNRICAEKGKYPASNGCEMRNACVNTIAPTGSLSLLAGCSSSIEPIFARTYEKTLHDGDRMNFSHDESMPISTEISPEWHIRMQAAFQRYTDNAVSKTINLPNEATVDDVKESVIMAYEAGCKGLTMYRQGTRDAPLKSIECENGRCKV